MNKRFMLCSFVLASMIASTSFLSAAPIGRSNSGREYLAGTEDLSKWSFGLYLMSQDREVTLFKVYPGVSMKSDKIMGYLGYDILPWITFYALAGNNQTRVSWGDDTSTKGEFGAGFQFNLLDTEIEDPTLLEDRIRIAGNIQYTKAEGQLADQITNIDWYDLSGSLTLSVVNDLDGDKFFVPNSIALFIGPAFSFLKSSQIEQDSEIGLTLGMDIFLNEKISIEFAYTAFEKSTYSGGINIRF